MDEIIYNRGLCDEKHKNIDGFIKKTDEKLDKFDENMEKLNSVSIQLSEIIKGQAKQLQTQNDSIEDLKQKPNQWMERIFTWVGSGIVMGIISFIFYTLKLGS